MYVCLSTAAFVVAGAEGYISLIPAHKGTFKNPRTKSHTSAHNTPHTSAQDIATRIECFANHSVYQQHPRTLVSRNVHLLQETGY